MIIENIANKPKEEKFRTLKLSNQIFNLNIGRFTNGMKLMRMIGFIPKTLPADKKKGTSEEKCIFYPHDTLTDIFMIAFDEI